MCLVEEPLARLKGPEGVPLFGVTSATFLGDRIVIAESSANRLLVYSFDGELLAILGGAGSGPGEFRSIGLIQTAGVRLRVFDWQLRRTTEFDQDGLVTRTLNLSIPEAFAAGNVIGFLPDGTSIGFLWPFPVPVTRGQVVRRTAVLGLFDSTGAFRRRLGTVPGSERYAEPWGRGGERRIALTFGKLTGAVVLGGSVAISDGTDWAIKLIDVDTGTESSYSPPGHFSPTEPTPPYLAVIREKRRGMDRDTRRILERAGVPNSLPPYGWSGSRPVAPLVAAQDGLLWAALSTAPGAGSQWRVFGGSAGMLIAASVVPTELLAVRDGVGITKRYDSLDVEFIEVREFRPGPCQRGVLN